MTNAVIINVQKKKRRNLWCCHRQKSTNTFKNIKPIMQIIKFVGAFPCRMTDRGVKLGGPFEYAWSAMFLLLHIIPLVILDPNLILEIWNAVLGPCFIFKEYLYLFAMTLDNYNCLRNRMTVSFFEKLEKIDEEARRLGHPCELSVTICWVLTIIDLTYNFFIMMYGLYSHCWPESDEECTWFISRIFLELAHTHYNLKWTILVYLMYQRFRHFNNIIRSDLLFKPTAYSTSRRTVTRDIVALHRNLVEIVDIFNSLTSRCFLIIFTADFAATLMHVKSMSTGATNFEIKLFVLLGFAEMTALCYVCDMAETEADAFGRHFTDCPTTLNYSSAIEERMNLAMHFMHNKIVFSGAEVFAVNLRTLFGMFLSFFSFTVILWSFN